MTTVLTDTPPSITPARVMKRCLAAFTAARKYFLVSDEWDVVLLDEDPDGALADIQIDPPYLRARVRVSMDYFQRRPQDIWATMGHECAHLLQAEYDIAQEAAMADIDNELASTLYIFAQERATTRLERMFCRDNKDPHCKEVRRA